MRYFDLDRVKKEILLLANSGTQTVKFVDRTFNANKKRAKELVSFILSEKGVGIPDGVCFHFEVAGDILDEELISLLISFRLCLPFSNSNNSSSLEKNGIVFLTASAFPLFR